LDSGTLSGKNIVEGAEANQRLFQNAAAVIAGETDFGFQRSMLYYPQILLKPIIIVPD